ncbi:Cytidine and deoxycytidylate deaminase zinc-binding region [Cyclonatronum proteinivorum]|uniref:Cytidine and deoxycytidylate deaminase zinc-binding region n=1 Tax=Cyclonatronum proteinivorum TaxID=1457365 RepID=A0A345UJQ0_9BACT|nr:Cytidine and deoxycytidylate deaminase zinc-binding region [Cyclonatronum proteinivorum]
MTSTNDPTAHAEVKAIRMACKEMGQFHLPGAVLYSSCEPCPMCLAAVYWANISAVYYAATRDEAAAIGFNDKFIYDEIPLDPEDRSIRFVNLKSESAAKLFEAWRLKEDRRAY